MNIFEYNIRQQQEPKFEQKLLSDKQFYIKSSNLNRAFSIFVDKKAPILNPKIILQQFNKEQYIQAFKFTRQQNFYYISIEIDDKQFFLTSQESSQGVEISVQQKKQDQNNTSQKFFIQFKQYNPLIIIIMTYQKNVLFPLLTDTQNSEIYKIVQKQSIKDRRILIQDQYGWLLQQKKHYQNFETEQQNFKKQSLHVQQTQKSIIKALQSKKYSQKITYSKWILNLLNQDYIKNVYKSNKKYQMITLQNAFLIKQTQSLNQIKQTHIYTILQKNPSFLQRVSFQVDDLLLHPKQNIYTSLIRGKTSAQPILIQIFQINRLKRQLRIKQFYCQQPGQKFIFWKWIDNIRLVIVTNKNIYHEIFSMKNNVFQHVKSIFIKHELNISKVYDYFFDSQMKYRKLFIKNEQKQREIYQIQIEEQVFVKKIVKNVKKFICGKQFLPETKQKVIVYCMLLNTCQKQNDNSLIKQDIKSSAQFKDSDDQEIPNRQNPNQNNIVQKRYQTKITIQKYKDRMHFNKSYSHKKPFEKFEITVELSDPKQEILQMMIIDNLQTLLILTNKGRILGYQLFKGNQIFKKQADLGQIIESYRDISRNGFLTVSRNQANQKLLISTSISSIQLIQFILKFYAQKDNNEKQKIVFMIEKYIQDSPSMEETMDRQHQVKSLRLYQDYKVLRQANMKGLEQNNYSHHNRIKKAQIKNLKSWSQQRKQSLPFNIMNLNGIEVIQYFKDAIVKEQPNNKFRRLSQNIIKLRAQQNRQNQDKLQFLAPIQNKLLLWGNKFPIHQTNFTKIQLSEFKNQQQTLFFVIKNDEKNNLLSQLLKQLDIIQKKSKGKKMKDKIYEFGLKQIIKMIFQIKQVTLKIPKYSQQSKNEEIYYQFVCEFVKDSMLIKNVNNILTQYIKLQQIQFRLAFKSQQQLYVSFQDKDLPQNYHIVVRTKQHINLFNNQLTVKDMALKLSVDILKTQNIKQLKQIQIEGQLDIQIPSSMTRAQSKIMNLKAMIYYKNSSNYRVYCRCKNLNIYGFEFKNIKLAFQNQNNQNKNGYKGQIQSQLNIGSVRINVNGLLIKQQNQKNIYFYSNVQNLKIQDIIRCFKEINDNPNEISSPYKIQFKETFFSIATQQQIIKNMKLKKGIVFTTLVQFPDIKYLPNTIKLYVQMNKQNLIFKGQVQKIKISKDFQIQYGILQIIYGRETRLSIQSVLLYKNMKIKGNLLIYKPQGNQKQLKNEQKQPNNYIYSFQANLLVKDLNKQLSVLNDQKKFEISQIKYTYNSQRRISKYNSDYHHNFQIFITKIFGLKCNLVLQYIDNRIYASLKDLTIKSDRIKWLDFKFQQIDLGIQLSPFRMYFYMQIKIAQTYNSIKLNVGANCIEGDLAVKLDKQWINPFGLCTLLKIKQQYIRFGRQFKLGLGMNFELIPTYFKLGGSLYFGKFKLIIEKLHIQPLDQIICIKGEMQNFDVLMMLKFLWYVLFKIEDTKLNKIDVFSIKHFKVNLDIRKGSMQQSEFYLEDIVILNFIQIGGATLKKTSKGIQFEKHAKPIKIGPLVFGGCQQKNRISEQQNNRMENLHYPALHLSIDKQTQQIKANLKCNLKLGDMVKEAKQFIFSNTATVQQQIKLTLFKIIQVSVKFQLYKNIQNKICFKINGNLAVSGQRLMRILVDYAKQIFNNLSSYLSNSDKQHNLHPLNSQQIISDLKLTQDQYSQQRQQFLKSLQYRDQQKQANQQQKHILLNSIYQAKTQLEEQIQQLSNQQNQQQFNDQEKKEFITNNQMRIKNIQFKIKELENTFQKLISSELNDQNQEKKQFLSAVTRIYQSTKQKLGNVGQSIIKTVSSFLDDVKQYVTKFISNFQILNIDFNSCCQPGINGVYKFVWSIKLQVKIITDWLKFQVVISNKNSNILQPTQEFIQLQFKSQLLQKIKSYLFSRNQGKQNFLISNYEQCSQRYQDNHKKQQNLHKQYFLNNMPRQLCNHLQKKDELKQSLAVIQKQQIQSRIIMSEILNDAKYSLIPSCFTSQQINKEEQYIQKFLEKSINKNKRNFFAIKTQVWTHGDLLNDTLYYYFINNDDKISQSYQKIQKKKQMVRKGFKAWENLKIWVKFQQTYDIKKAKIRIAFNRFKGDNSYVGKNCLKFLEIDDSTMNLAFGTQNQVLYFPTILHEIGHSLGLHHEHQNPHSQVKWNQTVVYDKFGLKDLNGTILDKKKIQRNILNKIASKQQSFGTVIDSQSIMMYRFPPLCFQEPQQFRINGTQQPKTFSQKDKSMIKSLYRHPQEFFQPIESRKFEQKANKQQISIFICIQNRTTHYFERIGDLNPQNQIFITPKRIITNNSSSIIGLKLSKDRKETTQITYKCGICQQTITIQWNSQNQSPYNIEATIKGRQKTQREKEGVDWSLVNGTHVHRIQNQQLTPYIFINRLIISCKKDLQMLKLNYLTRDEHQKIKEEILKKQNQERQIRDSVIKGYNSLVQIGGIHNQNQYRQQMLFVPSQPKQVDEPNDQCKGRHQYDLQNDNIIKYHYNNQEGNNNTDDNNLQCDGTKSLDYQTNTKKNKSKTITCSNGIFDDLIPNKHVKAQRKIFLKQEINLDRIETQTTKSNFDNVYMKKQAQIPYQIYNESISPIYPYIPNSKFHIRVINRLQKSLVVQKQTKQVRSQKRIYPLGIQIQIDQQQTFTYKNDGNYQGSIQIVKMKNVFLQDSIIIKWIVNRDKGLNRIKIRSLKDDIWVKVQEIMLNKEQQIKKKITPAKSSIR